MKLSTTIPFSGFYSSLHSSEIDEQLNMSFSNDKGDPYHFIVDKVYNNIDWFSVHIDYAREYTEALASEFEIKIEFEALVSPKYYNFETDRIFAYIELSEVQRIFDLVPKETLEKAIRANFTSYDGFISHYPNELAKWDTDLANWDHNQIGTLLEAYISTIEPEFDQFKEFDLMESARCNGVINNILYENTKEADRLYKICDYLRERENRV